MQVEDIPDAIRDDTSQKTPLKNDFRHDFSTFNPYDTVGPFYDTNLMYTRGLTHVSQDGRRHVSFGRGYTWYHLPEPQYDIGACLQTVHEKRERGTYEYVTEDLDDESGNCHICSTPTAFRCQKCDLTFYCSRTCQRNDWSKHKLDCQRMPPLVKKVVYSEKNSSNGKPTPSSQNYSQMPIRNGEQDPMPIEQNKLSNGSVHSSSGSLKTSNGHVDTKLNSLQHQMEAVTLNQRQQQQISPQSLCEQQNFELRSQQQRSPPQPSRPQQRTPQHQQSRPQQQQQSKTDLSSGINDEDFAFDKTKQFLPPNQFVDVTITNCVGHFEYFVQRNDRVNDFEAFSKVLAEAAKHAEFVKPRDNLDGIIEYDEIWYRVTIVSAEKSEVFFHDLGVLDTVEVKKFFCQSFKNYPYFARRIRISNTGDVSFKELGLNTCLSVKLVSVTGDATIIVLAKHCTKMVQNDIPSDQKSNASVEKKSLQVEVQQPKKPSVSMSEDEVLLSKLNSLPNVFDDLKPSDKGMFIMHSEIRKNEWNISLPLDLALFERLLNEMADGCMVLSKAQMNFRPNVGDYICGESANDGWYRGIVSSVQPNIKIAVVDECRYFTPLKCSPMPSGFEKIVTMGLICQLEPDAQWPKDINEGVFEIVKVSKEFATVKLIPNPEEPDKAFIGQLRKWIPKPEQKSIMYPKLESGNNVIILSVTNPNEVYVKIDEPAEKERVHKLEQEVAACARNLKRLAQKPVVGEMVLSLYELDENYYRAIVTKVENDKFLVKYIDYGNIEQKKMDHLYELPDSLKTEKASCIKVALKGIEKNIPMTVEATDQFSDLVLAEAPLQCTFNGNPINDGVILKTQRNEIVNDIIKGLLEPHYKKTDPDDDKKVYKISDLPPSTLGGEGDEVTAIPLAYYHASGTVMLAPDDENAIEAIHVQMAVKIQEYVKTTTIHYIPRDEELCIALFDGEYYRGLTVSSSVNPTHSLIFFIDYGNVETVAHKDIRLMTPDFIKLPALGIVCNVIPGMFPGTVSDKVKIRVKDILEEMLNERIQIKIISIEDIPSIDVPFIRRKLTEENLI